MVRYSARERHGLARRNGSKGQVSTRFPCVSIEGSAKIRVGRAVRGRGAGVGEGMQSWAAYERVRAGRGRGKEGPGRRFSPLRVEARSRARGYGKKVNAPQPRTHSRPTQRASLCERRCAGRRAASGRRASTIRSHARSLLSRSMQRAHVCNPVSTSRVLSTLPIGSLKFRRPPRSSLPSIPAHGIIVCRYERYDPSLLFLFLFADRRGGSIENFPFEGKRSASGGMGGGGSPRLRPFSSGGGGEGGRESCAFDPDRASSPPSSHFRGPKVP